MKSHQLYKLIRTLAAATFILVILGLAVVGAKTVFDRLERRFITPKPTVDIVQVPPGFRVSFYAQPAQASLPTVITFGPDGSLYLLTLDGNILRLQDDDGDAVVDQVEQVFVGSELGVRHAVGLAFHDRKLYLSDSGRISILSSSDQSGRYDTLTPIVEGLVSLQYPDHSNNGIIFGPDGKLYVGVGATTDHGPLREVMEASVLRMNPDGSDLEVFATGFRNPYDLTFSPEGDLFTADNNPSEFDETLNRLEPEEVIHIQQGQDYGFPDVYGFPPPGHASKPPITEFFPSVGSAGLVYYAADQFPAEYQNGLFVAQWGTGAQVAMDRQLTNGQLIAFVSLEPTANGTFRGRWQPFATFDLNEAYRPVDVTVGPDGALYILEWQSGSVYRVVYDATLLTTPPTPTPGRPSTDFDPALVTAGEALFQAGKGEAPACMTCHTLDGRAALGPSLLNVPAVADQRVPGLDAAAYVEQSIREPNAYIVPNYLAGYMYQNYDTQLSDDDIEALVAYVLSLSQAPK